MKNFKFKKGNSVKIEKLTDEKFGGNHPNEINVGYTQSGILHNDVIIDECVYVASLRTSPVTEILSEDTFRTRNSIYKLSYKIDTNLLEETETLLDEISNMSIT